eukprot:scaffold52234_cov48-Phaeocystis_antarctica.AAC.1
MRHASQRRALPLQAERDKRAAPPLRASGRDTACISAVSQQQALPSQAGRGKRAAHPTRVGVMRCFMRRALPSQAG